MAHSTITTAALLTLALAGPSAPAAQPGAIRGTVSITRDSPQGSAKADRSGVVVYLDLGDAADDDAADDAADDADAAPAPHAVHQINKTFVPAVSAVLKGTEVQFPNDDMIFHNVFSLSKTKRFDLGLYKSGTSKSVVPNRAGVIDVYCNIHPEMAAKVVVLDNPYFAVTGPDGAFTITGVPPGTYDFVAWQARGESVRGAVTVTAGGQATLDVALVETPQSTQHTRKDGSPYGRYN